MATMQSHCVWLPWKLSTQILKVCFVKSKWIFWGTLLVEDLRAEQIFLQDRSLFFKEEKTRARELWESFIRFLVEVVFEWSFGYAVL